MAMAHGDSLDGPHTQRLPEDLNVFCPECDYNMTGAVSSRCPWCGWEINPDELLAGVTSAWSFGRIGFAAAGAIGGVGWSVMATVLVRRGTTLTALDLATVLSMVLASIGCLTLSGLTVLARRSWPLRRGEACNLIGLLGLISIVVGVVGATSALRFETAPRVVRGIAVNGVMEFMLASAFFTLPGWTLLLMRLIGFGSTPTRGGDEPVRNFTGTSTGRGEAPFTVEFFRRYDRDQVTQECTAGRRQTTPAIDRAIALTWEAELAVADSAKRKTTFRSWRLTAAVSSMCASVT